MSEPEYHFVKGEGWVIQTCETITVTMNCGTVIRLERRKPNLGELCIWHHKGAWALVDWENWCRSNPFVSFSRDYSQYRDSDYDWVVAIT